ncbi:hypothetical protein Poli38472_002719 [Pythium oligandrum]|uniref:Transmembrane protein n=1 Tax=Pythium oligandrum TaxID=41045 RepID=A0A8K1FML5_PYTOL|nr:hypothetical protein Poli38472_002719 [Pythium oligandrum]|eukprot:TMW63778.1 hypothetical protein Poli38472_002719 [Pythium oligandrum]
MTGYDRQALAALEARAIRDKARLTYNTTLGSVCFFLVVVLGFSLPSPWRVLNGEWSSRFVPSLLALGAHGVLVISVVVAFRCAQVQSAELWEQLEAKYLRVSSAKPTASEPTDAATDRMTALNNVMNLKTLRSLSPVDKTTTASAEPDARPSRSFFDLPPVKTVEEGKAYLRRLQQAAREREQDDSAMGFSSSSMFGGGGGYPGDAYGSIYGSASLMPRVYQASGFDPYLRDGPLLDKEEDPLTTSSNPQVAWAQLEDLGLAMFMHLYVRNIRRLLACHVKDFVEAFVQNALELNECGVMADVLLRRVPVQALLCPPGQAQQLTNVTLYDMLHGLTQHPSFVSKTRRVHLFEEHVTFEKYLNVGDATGAEYSSLERQQYVLERLIMLSKDRNLDRFRWNKGSTWKGKEWTEALPSDAEILMNVFSCILDNLLPADTGRDRPFWKSYFMGKAPRRPFTTSVRNRLFFVQTVQRPPHFKVLAKAAVREIVPCEENTFHAIVVYLHAVKKMKAGHLESINLHRIIDAVFQVSK